MCCTFQHFNGNAPIPTIAAVCKVKVTRSVDTTGPARCLCHLLGQSCIIDYKSEGSIGHTDTVPRGSALLSTICTIQDPSTPRNAQELRHSLCLANTRPHTIKDRTCPAQIDPQAYNTCYQTCAAQCIGLCPQRYMPWHSSATASALRVPCECLALRVLLPQPLPCECLTWTCTDKPAATSSPQRALPAPQLPEPCK